MSPRPQTLSEVAAQSDSLEEFGRHFRDWLHELGNHSSRPQVEAAILQEPRRLARRFEQGNVADAWLAAYAELIADKLRLPIPSWTSGRVLAEPWFATGGTDTRSRIAALRDSPGPFKSRNLYTPGVDLPLRLSRGRPAKPAAALRRSNAERQRRFRARRKAELVKLRRLAK